MQHLLFIFTDKLIFFSKFWYIFGIFLIPYFGICLVYNLEHFGIFYSAKPGNSDLSSYHEKAISRLEDYYGHFASSPLPVYVHCVKLLLFAKL